MYIHYLITDVPSNKIVFTLFDLGFDNKYLTIVGICRLFYAIPKYFMEPYPYDMIQLKHYSDSHNLRYKF